MKRRDDPYLIAMAIALIILAAVILWSIPARGADVVEDVCTTVSRMQPGECGDVLECTLPYVSYLQQAAMLAHSLYGPFGYTLPRDTVVVAVHDTVTVYVNIEGWRAAYPDSGGEALGWGWKMSENPSGPWFDCISTDSLRVYLLRYLCVYGWNDAGTGPTSESVEVD